MTLQARLESLILNDEQIRELVAEAREMQDYDDTVNLVADISANAYNDAKASDASLLDRLVFISAESCLAGYAGGISAFNEALKTALADIFSEYPESIERNA